MADGKSLEDLRREVDAIDDALDDLLMRRAAATGAIARLKPQAGGRVPLALAMRPAREAEIMRRIAARHRGAPPLATAIAVLREILSASLRAQVPFRLHVFAGPPEFADLAHGHFGTVTPLVRYESVSRVVHACGDDADSIGVVPFPSADDVWWTNLAPAGATGPRVIARLPYVAGATNGHAAYAIAAIEQEPSGDDTTLLRAEIAQSFSRTKLVSQLKDAGIVARVVAAGAAGERDYTPVLLEADGFVTRNDPRLAAFCAQVGLAAGSIFPVGGFANPIATTVVEPVS